MPMKDPPYPGLSVRHDCIEPLGLTRKSPSLRNPSPSRTQHVQMRIESGCLTEALPYDHW